MLHLNYRNKIWRMIVMMFLSGIRLTCGVSSKNVTALMDDLFGSGYSKYVRPLQNQSSALDLKVGFSLISILAFDEIDDQLTFKAVIYSYWVDEFLRWKPEDYGGMESLNVPSELIWIPNIILTSTNGELARFDVKGGNLRLYSNGTLGWLHVDTFKSRCLANVKNFPLDMQSCNVYFTGFGYLPTEFRMSQGILGTFEKEFDNGQWDRDSVSVSYDPIPGTTLPVMTVNIKFHRKYLYMFLNILIPIVMLNCLCILVFFIPVESGEKITYGVTLLLSNTVFLLLLSDNLPKISDPVPSVSIYLIVNMMNSLFMCLCSIVNVRMFHKTGSPTVFWRKFVVSKLCCSYRQPISEGQGHVKTQRTASDGTESTDLDVNECPDPMCNWKAVSRKLDRMLFLIFTVVIIVVNLSFVIYINLEF